MENKGKDIESLDEVLEILEKIDEVMKEEKELQELQDLKEVKLKINNTEQNLTEKKESELWEKFNMLSKMISEEYLTVGKQGLILSIAHGNNISEASKELGISRTTIYKWLEEPKIREKIRETKEEIFLTSLEALKTLNLRAIQELAIQFKSIDGKRRLEVAKYIIDKNIKMLEWEWEKRTLEFTEEKRGNESKSVGKVKVETGKVKKGAKSTDI